jgi:hypothetical protein
VFSFQLVGDLKEILVGHARQVHEVKHILAQALNSHFCRCHISWAEQDFAAKVYETSVVQVEDFV